MLAFFDIFQEGENLIDEVIGCRRKKTWDSSLNVIGSSTRPGRVRYTRPFYLDAFL